MAETLVQTYCPHCGKKIELGVKVNPMLPVGLERLDNAPKV